MKHTTRTMQRARELHAAGWNYAEISRMLTSEFGVTVSRTAVAYWCDRKMYERHRRLDVAQKNARNAASATFRLSGNAGTDAYRAEFMRRLRAEGVPPSSIAKVHRVVFGRSIDEKTVKKILVAGNTRPAAPAVVAA